MNSIYLKQGPPVHSSGDRRPIPPIDDAAGDAFQFSLSL